MDFINELPVELHLKILKGVKNGPAWGDTNSVNAVLPLPYTCNRVCKAWMNIMTNEKNLKDLERQEISDIVIAQSGADLLLKVTSFSGGDLQIYQSSSDEKTLTKDEDEWDRRMETSRRSCKKRRVVIEEVPLNFRKVLKETLLIFKPREILFENIIVSKSLIHFLCETLVMVVKTPTQMGVLSFEDEGVSFNTDVTAQDIGSLATHFVQLDHLPPLYYTEDWFQQWISNANHRDYRLISDNPLRNRSLFAARNRNMNPVSARTPISLIHFERVHIFRNLTCEVNLDQLLIAVQNRLVAEEKPNIDWRFGYPAPGNGQTAEHELRQALIRGGFGVVGQMLIEVNNEEGEVYVKANIAKLLSRVKHLEFKIVIVSKTVNQRISSWILVSSFTGMAANNFITQP